MGYNKNTNRQPFQSEYDDSNKKYEYVLIAFFAGVTIFSLSYMVGAKWAIAVANSPIWSLGA